MVPPVARDQLYIFMSVTADACGCPRAHLNQHRGHFQISHTRFIVPGNGMKVIAINAGASKSHDRCIGFGAWCHGRGCDQDFWLRHHISAPNKALAKEERKHTVNTYLLCGRNVRHTTHNHCFPTWKHHEGSFICDVIWGHNKLEHPNEWICRTMFYL